MSVEEKIFYTSKEMFLRNSLCFAKKMEAFCALKKMEILVLDFLNNPNPKTSILVYVAWEEFSEIYQKWMNN